MMDLSSDLTQALVTAKQEALRRSKGPFFPGRETGMLRRWMGNLLIHLGERIGGAERVPAPDAAPNTLAMQ